LAHPAQFGLVYHVLIVRPPADRGAQDGPPSPARPPPGRA
jgi:hypothetical protein